MALDRLLGKLDLSESKLTVQELKMTYKEATGRLKKIVTLCHESSMLKSTSSYINDQERLLMEVIHDDDAVSLHLMLRGSNFKLNLLERLPHANPQYNVPPLIYALRCDSVKAIRELLLRFKARYEKSGDFRPEAYLRFQDKFFYGLVIAQARKTYYTTDNGYKKSPLNEILEEFIDLMPQQYIRENPVVEEGLTLYEYIFLNNPQLLFIILNHRHPEYAKLVATDLLFLAVLHCNAKIFDVLLRHLSYIDCNKRAEKAKSRSQLTPLQLAVGRMAVDFEERSKFIKPLIDKLSVAQVKEKTLSGENILHLCLSEVKQHSYISTARYSTFIQLLIKTNDPSMLNTDLMRTVKKLDRSLYVVCKLFAANINVHQIICSIIDEQIARLENRVDLLTLFGPSKRQKFMALKLLIAEPVKFYNQFFRYADFSKFSPEVNNEELLAHTLKAVYYAVPYDHEKGKDGYSIASVFKTSRIFNLRKTNAEIQLEAQVNKTIEDRVKDGTVSAHFVL